MTSNETWKDRLGFEHRDLIKTKKTLSLLRAEMTYKTQKDPVG